MQTIKGGAHKLEQEVYISENCGPENAEPVAALRMYLKRIKWIYVLLIGCNT